MKLISFVIPCYCSTETIGNVTKEIQDTIKNSDKYGYEIILVNDYSPDNTLEVISQLCKDERIKVISFSKNFGQHAAIMAGLAKAKGDIIICLDDDGQTPGDEIHKLLEKIEEGFDVVYAKYESKKHSITRNFASYINELMARSLLNKPKKLYLSSYFAMQRFIVDEILRYDNSYPYLAGLVLRSTKHITNVNVKHRERSQGQSGYNLKKLIGLWLNGFTSFSIKPLRVATALGIILALVGFGIGVYAIINKFVNSDVPLGWSSLIACNVFVGGVILFVLGMIGEYIGRIYISINNNPQYVVKKTINLEDE
jgi:undecaprenyl-phosphate 4-deoxy-4-formamido-L-arabinose transferase